MAIRVMIGKELVGYNSYLYWLLRPPENTESKYGIIEISYELWERYLMHEQEEGLIQAELKKLYDALKP